MELENILFVPIIFKQLYLLISRMAVSQEKIEEKQSSPLAKETILFGMSIGRIDLLPLNLGRF